jgi:hypothetical protein
MPDQDPKPRKFRLFKDHEVTVSTDIAEEWDNIKSHFRRNKTTYVAVGVAGITYALTRSISSPHIGGTVGVPVNGPIGTIAENVANARALQLFSNKPHLTMTTIIEAGRQGPPSWVVRCKETGDIFTSQAAAAREMNLSPVDLSRHLNGLRPDVLGNHFDRICMAA